MDDIEDCGKQVISALTNSYAYQCYNKSIESIKQHCEEDYNDNIKFIDENIGSYIRGGITRAKFYFNYYPTYAIKGKYYISDIEVKKLIDHYNYNGFLVKYKIKKGIFNWLTNYKAKKLSSIKIYINWDFSNK
jgi:hypothetical protein